MSIWGWLKYNATKVPIQAVILRMPAFTGAGEGSAVFVTAVKTDAEIEAVAQADRIVAGARVVDVPTGKVHPVESLDCNLTASMFPSDLSTLYSADATGCTGGVDPDCVRLAYKRYAVNQQSAKDVYDVCVVAALGAQVACLALFSWAVLAPTPMTWAAAALNAARCLAIFVTAVALCAVNYEIALRNAAANLIIDLEACGVHVWHT